MPKMERLIQCRTLIAGLLLALGMLGPLTDVAAETTPWIVAGRVTDSASARPLVGARVTGDGRETRTDAAGEYRLELQSSTATIEITLAGFMAQRLAVAASAGEARSDVALDPATRFQEKIEVRGDPLSETPASMPVRPKDVTTVAGGAENVFRVLTTLPGVTATDEITSRLSVRGGGPDQNLTVMDGVEIHDPYRLFGLVSAFNPETVDGFELITGAFSARYGDRLSSILIIDNREGSRQRAFSGSSAISLTDGNTILEGRLPRAAGTWLVTGRRTYYDLVAEQFTDSDLPAFDDVQGKVSLDLRRGRRLTLFALRSREGTDASLTGGSHAGEFYTRTTNDVLSARFDRPLGQLGSWRTLLAYYETGADADIDGRFRGGQRRSNTPNDEDINPTKVIWTSGTRVRDFSLRQETRVALSGSQQVEAGVELHRLRTSLSYEIAGAHAAFEPNGSSARGGAGLGDALNSEREDTRFGAWLLDRARFGSRLDVEAGLRLDRSTINGLTELQPRFQASLALAAKTHLRLAAGRHTQSPGYEKLVSSDYLMDLSGAGRLAIDNERSNHVVLGLERELGRGLTARVEGYYKSYANLILGRIETPAETAARVATYDFPAELALSVPSAPLITSSPTNDGSGEAYGLDLYLARRARSESTRLSGWIAYTYGFANLRAYGRSYPFDYDRRHSLSVVGELRLSRRLDLALTGRLASGFPSTPPLGLRVSATRDERDADGDGNVAEQMPERDLVGRLVYVPDYGGVANLNTGREPTYARIDARATWKPGFGKGRLRLYLDVINVLNRKNVGMMQYKLEYDPDPAADRPRLTTPNEGAIPFLPSIGIHYRF
jgi:hypothetical protein